MTAALTALAVITLGLLLYGIVSLGTRTIAELLREEDEQ